VCPLRNSRNDHHSAAADPPEPYVSISPTVPEPRPRLRPLRWRLASRRRRREAAVGLVGRRGGAGGALASRSKAASLPRAARRLASWVRCSDAVTEMTPSVRRLDSLRSTRDRSSGGMLALPATSYRSSTRESAVLTPCPPGPELREKRSRSSPAGTTQRPRTTRSSATPPVSPIRRCTPLVVGRARRGGTRATVAG
jgi:hypothetical protein